MSGSTTTCWRAHDGSQASQREHPITMRWLKVRPTPAPETELFDADYRAAALQWGMTADYGRTFFWFVEWDDIPKSIREHAEMASARIVNAALEGRGEIRDG